MALNGYAPATSAVQLQSTYSCSTNLQPMLVCKSRCSARLLNSLGANADMLLAVHGSSAYTFPYHHVCAGGVPAHDRQCQLSHCAAHCVGKNTYRWASLTSSCLYEVHADPSHPAVHPARAKTLKCYVTNSHCIGIICYDLCCD